MPEDSERKSNLIEDVIKSRLSHPFIGTFIVSFVGKNYDILLILFTKLNQKDIYNGLECFKTSLSNDEWRISLPIIITIIVPFLIEPVINLLHQKTLAYFRRLTRNLVENEEIKVIKDDYERLLRLSNVKDQEITRLKKLIIPWIESLMNFIYLEKVRSKTEALGCCYILSSKEELGVGDLVSISEREKIIYPFTNKDLPFGGKVLWKLSTNMYLVLLDYYLSQELSDINGENFPVGTRFFYSHRKGKFVINSIAEDVHVDRVIYATVSTSHKVIPNVIKVTEHFKKDYFEDVVDYLFNKNENAEKKRRYFIKPIFEFIAFPFKKLFTWIENKRQKETT